MPDFLPVLVSSANRLELKLAQDEPVAHQTGRVDATVFGARHRVQTATFDFPPGRNRPPRPVSKSSIHLLPSLTGVGTAYPGSPIEGRPYLTRVLPVGVTYFTIVRRCAAP